MVTHRYIYVWYVHSYTQAQANTFIYVSVISRLNTMQTQNIRASTTIATIDVSAAPAATAAITIVASTHTCGRYALRCIGVCKRALGHPLNIKYTLLYKYIHKYVCYKCISNFWAKHSATELITITTTFINKKKYDKLDGNYMKIP